MMLIVRIIIGRLLSLPLFGFQDRQHIAIRTHKSFYVAEAGIEMAIDELLKGKDGYILNIAFASSNVKNIKVESEKINNK